MVIGKGGAVLSAVRTKLKGALPKGMKLELIVVVDKNWQHRRDRVERLGY
jgi:GTPase Era involved in 16S rRNA processing